MDFSSLDLLLPDFGGLDYGFTDNQQHDLGISALPTFEENTFDEIFRSLGAIESDAASYHASSPASSLPASTKEESAQPKVTVIAADALGALFSAAPVASAPHPNLAIPPPNNSLRARNLPSSFFSAAPPPAATPATHIAPSAPSTASHSPAHTPDARAPASPRSRRKNSLSGSSTGTRTPPTSPPTNRRLSCEKVVNPLPHPVFPSAANTRPLPRDWEEAKTEEGQVYYINHKERITTWTDPRGSSSRLNAPPPPPPPPQKRASESDWLPSMVAEEPLLMQAAVDLSVFDDAFSAPPRMINPFNDLQASAGVYPLTGPATILKRRKTETGLERRASGTSVDLAGFTGMSIADRRRSLDGDSHVSTLHDSPRAALFMETLAE